MSIGGMADGSVAAEIYDRHKRSSQPESREVCAVLGAILEVVAAEGLQPSPTTLFAAVMSSLAKEETQDSAEVCTAFCTVLAAVLGRMPTAVLRSKFSISSQVMCSIVQKHATEASVIRAALPCLSHVLAALDPADWPSATQPFTLLLRFCIDARPKVRRRAQGGLVDVLAAVQRTTAIDNASALVLKVSEAVLAGPEAAARAAAAGSNKQRVELEAAITSAVSDALHWLGAIKQAIPVLSPTAALSISQLLLKLFPLRQPLLCRHATDALAALLGSPNVRIGPTGMADVLSSVLAAQSAWDRRDADTLLSVIKLLEDGYIRLHELDPILCGARLPAAIGSLVPLLAAEQDGVRFASGQCLKNLLHHCVDPALVATGVSHVAMPRGKPPAAAAIVAAVSASLDARNEDAWENALPVVGNLLASLGHAGAPLAERLLQRLGELCAGAADIEEDGDVAMAEIAGPAQEALGAAIRSLGPEAVLGALPLNLQEGFDGTGEARTWLLPLLRSQVRSARLGYWASSLMPAARLCGARAAAATDGGPPRALEALQCRALELQLWGSLPAFCSWPEDAAEAFRASAKDIGAAFQNRPDLRPSICSSLQRLCLQNRSALQTGGAGDILGPSQPVGLAPVSPAVEEDEDGSEDGADASPVDIPAHYTVETATNNITALRAFSKSWLTALCAAFTSTPAEERGPLAAAITAYASISDPETAAQFFRVAIKKLIKVTEDAASDEMTADALREGGADGSARRCTFLDLALALSSGVETAGVATLFKAARACLQEKDVAVQKKAYKVLAYVCEQRTDFVNAPGGLQQALEALLGAAQSANSAARRFRMRCLKAVVLLLLDEKVNVDFEVPGVEEATTDAKRQQLVATLVAEIILCCKEVNTKTRAAAYELLIDIAHAMHDARPPPDVIPEDETMGEGMAADLGGLHALFSMALGGLVGATPHMIAASVMALARLLYEFAGALSGLVPQLLPAVLSLLRSKSREIIKAVLGFVKVVAMRLPVEMIIPQLGPILEGVLLWAADSKNKFKLKVRVIVERLARRCGYDAVAGAIPDGDRKLLVHIRKERTKKESRRNGETASQADGEDNEARTARSSAARTARASQWAHTDVFSDDDGDDETRTRGAATVRTARTGATSKGAAKGGKSRAGVEKGSGPRLPGQSDGQDPLDLLDAGTSRQLVRSVAGRGRDEGMQDDFGRSEGGKLIIRDEEAIERSKRKRSDGYNSDDSDFDDLRNKVADASAAMKAVRFANSVAGTGAERSVKSMGARSAASGRSDRSGKSGRDVKKGPTITGDRYKAKHKGKMGGGDSKGNSKHEPFAYWPLDKRLTNRRPDKQAAAKSGLASIVKGAKSGALKGGKAKRQRMARE